MNLGMNGFSDSFDNMRKSEACDRSECFKISQDVSSLGMSAAEGKGVADDADGRYTTCSTKIYSEMPTLESIPTLSDASFIDNPLFEELHKPTPLSDNDVPARRAAFECRGMKLRGAQANVLQQCDSPITSSSFNHRKLFGPKKRQEKNSEDSEEATTATKEDKIELEGRPCKFFFKGPPKNSDADFGSVDDYDDLTFWSSDVSLLDTQEVPTSAGKDADLCPCADLCTAPPMPSSSVESCASSSAMHSMADMSLLLGLSVPVGPPGRALRKKAIAAMFG